MHYEQLNNFWNKFANLKLHPGQSAQTYMNQFMIYVAALEKILEEKMNRSNKVQTIFGRNIDHAYVITVKLIRAQITI